MNVSFNPNSATFYYDKMWNYFQFQFLRGYVIYEILCGSVR